MTTFDTAEACLWQAEADRFDRMLEPYARALLDAAALVPGESVLDVGCGAGATTLLAADATGAATGIDVNAGLIELATCRARNRAGVRFLYADAATHPYEAPFDAVISRFGMMLFEHPPAAFAHLAHNTRPGGTVTYVTWTNPAANAWHALPFHAGGLAVDERPTGAFTLSDKELNVRLLERGGFGDVTVDTIEYPAWVAADVEDALGLLRRSLTHRLPDPATLEAVIAGAGPLFAAHAGDDGVRLPAVALLCHATRKAGTR